MTPDGDQNASELVTLGQTIETRIRELRASGQFSDVVDDALKDAKARRDDIQRRLEAAIQQGNLLETLKDEVRRDFNAIGDAISALADRLGGDAMRAPPETTREGTT